MTVDYAEWLNLALRWLHVTAGIAWIGSSFYFIWLDNHLKAPVGDGAASGELWSVHGGGFYHKQKYQVAPAAMPSDLHWFKWEAYFTWLSGFSLLVLIYYFGASSFLIDPAKASLSPAAAIAISLGSIAGAWLFYDLLCRSPLRRDDRAIGIVWFLFLVLAAVALDRLLNARAAYIQVGSIIGTAMVANVFFVIIPNQRRVVADLIAQRTPDPALGKGAKQRSLHNNYMTLPVLFIMISHHYPMTHGADRPWLVLALIGAIGVLVRHVFNLRHRGIMSPGLLVMIAALALATVTYVSIEKRKRGGGIEGDATQTMVSHVAFAQVEPILRKHCTTCHSARPSHPGFQQPPAGLVFDTHAHISAAANRIKLQAVDTETMPLGNETGMTKAERRTLGAWIAEGSPR